MDRPFSKKATGRLDTRLLSASFFACALAVSTVYTPLHLVTESHVWDHQADDDAAVVSFDAEHDHDHDGDPQHGHHSPHEPHPASEHHVQIAVVRYPAIPIPHIALFAHAVVFFEIETPSGLFRLSNSSNPRTIPPLSPRRIRAPPLG